LACAVTLDVKARVVTVKGPRGVLTKNLKHMMVDIYKLEDGKTVKVEKWFGATKESASIRSACSHMLNMITGVTKVRTNPPRACERPAWVSAPAPGWLVRYGVRSTWRARGLHRWSGRRITLERC
jgi:hypothetical protein